MDASKIAANDRLTYRGQNDWVLVSRRPDGLLNIRRPGDNRSTIADPIEITLSLWAVNLWGSKPGTEDDCYTGSDFDNLAEALEAYRDPKAYAEAHDWKGWTSALEYCRWIEICGPATDWERELFPTSKRHQQLERELRREHEEWRREQAREAGMLHGIGAYNEAMGWDVEVDR